MNGQYHLILGQLHIYETLANIHKERYHINN
jgi:hypothetical protein